MSLEKDGKKLHKRGRVVVVERVPDLEVPLENIYWPDPTDITEEQIKNMATSLLLTGQIEPIIVDAADAKGKHRGIVGRLRYEGMKYRWHSDPQDKTILCRIRRFKDDVDGLIEIKTWQLVENLHRREVPAMQRARQYRELYDLLRQKSSEDATLNAMTMQIEELTGNKESLKTVHHYLELTKLQPKTQDILTSEKLSLRAGLEFARVTDPKKQVKAAEDVQKRPDLYENVQSIKYHVETFIEEERKDRQKQRLEKRAKQLREGGKIVFVETGYSYTDRQKFEVFYGEVPEACKTGEGCSKLGILLSGNFQQKPICTDKKCYERMQVKQHMKITKEQKEKDKKFEEERAKVYNMPLDVRHWRIAVFGLIDTWELGQMLGVGRGDEKILWDAVTTLTQEQCQQLLLKKATDEVLTTRDHWGDEDAKRCIVKEFGLTPGLFLKEEEPQEDPPCANCAKDGVSCNREHFYKNDEDKLVCDQTVPKKEK